jgi:hypothetical protein
MVGKSPWLVLLDHPRAMGGSKKRCSICGCWFYPNPKVRHCQRTCGKAECRAAHKKRSQAHWSRKNPNYWRARRLAEKANAAGEARSGAATIRSPPAAMAQIPWDVVQEAFGAEGTVILAFLVRVACRSAQDAMDSKSLESTKEFVRLDDTNAQDAMDSHGPPGDPYRDLPADV